MKPNTRPASPYGLVFKSVSSIKGKLAGESCSFSVYGNSLTKQLIHFTCRWLGRQLAYCGTRAQEHTPPGQGKVKALVPGNNPNPMPLERWIAVFSLWSTALLRHFEGHWSPWPIFYVLAVTVKPKCLWWCKEKTIQRLLVKAEVLGGVSWGLMIDDWGFLRQWRPCGVVFFILWLLVYLLKLTVLTWKFFDWFGQYSIL